MLVVIVYDISTAEAGGQKRLRKVARLSSSAHDASNCAKPDEKVERLHFRMPD